MPRTNTDSAVNAFWTKGNPIEPVYPPIRFTVPSMDIRLLQSQFDLLDTMLLLIIPPVHPRTNGTWHGAARSMAKHHWCFIIVARRKNREILTRHIHPEVRLVAPFSQQLPHTRLGELGMPGFDVENRKHTTLAESNRTLERPKPRVPHQFPSTAKPRSNKPESGSSRLTIFPHICLLPVDGFPLA